MASIIRPPNPGNSSRQLRRWQAFSSTSSLETQAAKAIELASQQALQQRKAFHLVLAGGNTPRRVYELLRNITTDWSKWHIYFGDERCLPLDHPERNSQMAELAWLNFVSIPAAQIHIIPAEQGAIIAANIYANTIATLSQFDLVMLGLGEDGHTASLFPDHDWGNYPAAPATLAISDAPKPPPQRVSLSAQRLSQTQQLIFLVTGNTKKQAVINWHNEKNIPAAAITPSCGVDIYIEQDLLPMLNTPQHFPPQ
jgi:6-phosphogluconolactonase